MEVVIDYSGPLFGVVTDSSGKENFRNVNVSIKKLVFAKTQYPNIIVILLEEVNMKEKIPKVAFYPNMSKTFLDYITSHLKTIFPNLKIKTALGQLISFEVDKVYYYLEEIFHCFVKDDNYYFQEIEKKFQVIEKLNKKCEDVIKRVENLKF
jgi:hypothetical protein